MIGTSILIVDDDKLLVEKLKKTMNWESLNISAVFTAYNIRQARALIEEYPIHIMLCDIDMPQGSGLELLEWIREQNRNIECIFLSAYANFAYAQMAVRFGVMDFLLKPVSNAELEQAVQKAVAAVRKNHKDGADYVRTERVVFWENLLLCRIPEDICIRDALKKGIFRQDETFCMILVKVLDTADQISKNKDYALLDFAVRNISYEYFDHVAEQLLLRDRFEILEAVAHISNLEWMFVLRQRTENTDELIRNLREVLMSGNNRQITVYLGTPCSLEKIGKSRQRLEDMEQNAVLNEAGILKEENWKGTKNNFVQPPWSLWEQEIIQSRGLSVTADRILTYLESQQMDGGWCKEAMRQFVREMVQMIYHYLYRKELSFSQIFDDREFIAYVKAASDSEMQIRAFIQYIFEKLEGNEKLDTRQQNVVQYLKEYIELHLNDNLSRTVLAQKVYLSEGYISKLFQKETGISLVNYIAERRMEKAKEYLVYTTLPVSRIATEVGYSNFSYFSKTFRDLTGITPNEYRTRQKKVTT